MQTIHGIHMHALPWFPWCSACIWISAFIYTRDTSKSHHIKYLKYIITMCWFNIKPCTHTHALYTQTCILKLSVHCHYPPYNLHISHLKVILEVLLWKEMTQLENHQSVCSRSKLGILAEKKS